MSYDADDARPKKAESPSNPAIGRVLITQSKNATGLFWLNLIQPTASKGRTTSPFGISRQQSSASIAQSPMIFNTPANTSSPSIQTTVIDGLSIVDIVHHHHHHLKQHCRPQKPRTLLPSSTICHSCRRGPLAKSRLGSKRKCSKS